MWKNPNNTEEMNVPKDRTMLRMKERTKLGKDVGGRKGRGVHIGFASRV
jgi:hypothetical protein